MGRWLLRVELSLVRIFNPYLPDWELRLMGVKAGRLFKDFCLGLSDVALGFTGNIWGKPLSQEN